MNMNIENEPIYIGAVEDVDKGCVENFEYEEVNYAICHLEDGFYVVQGQCICEEHALLSEGEIEGEDLECPICNRSFSIISGDPISDLEVEKLKVYEITEENGKLYLNL